MNDWTFEDFEPEPEFVRGADYFFLIMFGVRHREQEPATDLFVVYLWHVTNTENFIEGGYKPRLQEMGPYAYVKQAYKYDIVSPRKSLGRFEFCSFLVDVGMAT